MTKQKIKELIKKFNINYLSAYRWINDRPNNLSAEDFLSEKIEQFIDEALKQQREEIREMIKEMPDMSFNASLNNSDKVMITRDARWTKDLLKAIDNLD